VSATSAKGEMMNSEAGKMTLLTAT